MIECQFNSRSAYKYINYIIMLERDNCYTCPTLPLKSQRCVYRHGVLAAIHIEFVGILLNYQSLFNSKVYYNCIVIYSYTL